MEEVGVRCQFLRYGNPKGGVLLQGQQQLFSAPLGWVEKHCAGQIVQQAQTRLNPRRRSRAAEGF